LRIVSLLPSATEIVCALGLRSQLVGVTHECDYPEDVKALPKVTRTLIPPNASSGEIDRLVRERLKTGRALYSLDTDMLKQLAPDLIVTQSLCDVCAVADEEVRAAAQLLSVAPRIINLEPQCLADVFEAIRQVAAATNSVERGEQVVRNLTERVRTVERRVAARIQQPPRVALLEWLDPPFSSGHWNPELVRLAGGLEGLGREGERSQTLDWTAVIAWQPQVIVIACCGFTIERTLEDLPSVERVAGWRELPAVRNGRVYVVDGSQYFNRPGPRLVDSLETLAQTLDPQDDPGAIRAGHAATMSASAAYRIVPRDST
jgi:iron complex transport system substrate-binding protein